SYTSEGFSPEDQKRLARIFYNLTERGCKVVLSNSDTPLIHRLYSDYKIERVSVSRTINCIGKKRKGYTELIISNIEKTS
ncbi:DNA adenine methylase, partial [Candidatus Bathyarchaeota archaeon]|nr:DNA adenine methylase [Candidatus Bathyarchaeota archaeon]